jgi:hypothetical protein
VKPVGALERSFEALAAPTLGVHGLTGHDGRHLDQQSGCRELAPRL